MKKAIKTTLTVVITLLLIITIILVTFSQRVAMNPAGTVGNTAGNLNNDGLFCEYDGTVYFYNSFNGGGLFSMAPDESGMRRLNTLEVRNILAGGKYLYYFHTGASTVSTGFGHAFGMKSFLRSKLDGSNSEALTNDVIVTGQLVDNYLYLLTSGNAGPSFYKMKIDGSGRTWLTMSSIPPAPTTEYSITTEPRVTIISMPWIPPRMCHMKCGKEIFGLPLWTGIMYTTWMWPIITGCAAIPGHRM